MDEQVLGIVAEDAADRSVGVIAVFEHRGIAREELPDQLQSSLRVVNAFAQGGDHPLEIPGKAARFSPVDEPPPPLQPGELVPELLGVLFRRG